MKNILLAFIVLAGIMSCNPGPNNNKPGLQSGDTIVIQIDSAKVDSVLQDSLK